MDIYHLQKSPHDLTAQEYREIVTLHQSFFNIHAEDIIGLLRQRDVVVLYREKKTDRLIGTMGFQWTECQHSVCLYVGNTVVDKNYLHTGLLYSGMLSSMLTTARRFPLLSKYVVGLATTPKVYDFCTKFKDSWPKEDGSMPEEVRLLMMRFAKEYGGSKFQAKGGVFIMKTMAASQETLARGKAHEVSKEVEERFYQLNPGAKFGDQLLCLAQLNLRTVVTLAIYRVRSQLRRKLKSFSFTPIKRYVTVFTAVFALFGAVGVVYALTAE